MEAKKITPIDLKSLKPQEAEIELMVDGEIKTYKMRAVNLDDWVWMAEHFGQDPSVKLRRAVPLNDMAKICYRLLIDKTGLLSEQKEIVNDEGDLESVKISGPQKFKQSLIGFEGITKLSEAFTKCLGAQDITEEDLDKLAKSVEKKTKVNKKK